MAKLYTKFEGDPAVNYDVFTADTLRYIVTLTYDLLTLNGCLEFLVT